MLLGTQPVRGESGIQALSKHVSRGLPMAQPDKQKPAIPNLTPDPRKNLVMARLKFKQRLSAPEHHAVRPDTKLRARRIAGDCLALLIVMNGQTRESNQALRVMG